MVRRQKKIHCGGAAAVEFALVLPLMLLVSFGAIKYGWLFLKAQQITNATRYGARVAIRSDSVTDDVYNAIDNLMTAAGMGTSGYNVTITLPAGSTWDDVQVGDPITVEVTVPGANIDILDIPLFPPLGTIGASNTMAKEGF